MKAYRIGFGAGIEGLKLQDEKVPALGPHDVRIAIRAVSLNFRDLMFAHGTYRVSSAEPRIPCSDGAGEVIEVGSQVSRFKVGARVAGTFFPKWIDGEPTPENTEGALGANGDGTLAEQVVLNEESLVRVPDHLSFDEAATLPCAAVTAWNALFVEGGIKAGGTVLIQGTGGVSIHALQLAHAAGLQTIITSSSDAKLESARKLGADATINYRTTPEWQDEVLRITNGRGVDLVLEVGGQDTVRRSIASLRMGGTVAVIGGLSGWGASLEAPSLIGHAGRLIGIFVGHRKMFEDLNRFVSVAKLRPIVDRTFAFTEARQAYEHLESGSHFGKVVIRV
jgi:NADPH:quinone reductase-like Zn-dependent oxidoreductase